MRQSELLSRQARLIERSAHLRTRVHTHAAAIAAPFSSVHQGVQNMRALPWSGLIGLLAIGLARRALNPAIMPLLRLWDVWRAWKA